jgi:hypothetical protein
MPGTTGTAGLGGVPFAGEAAATATAKRSESAVKAASGFPVSRSQSLSVLSAVVADAFAGELTRGSIGTIRATVETENTRSHQGGVWLGDLDSNQD